jgi:hypothetical protein
MEGKQVRTEAEIKEELKFCQKKLGGKAGLLAGVTDKEPTGAARERVIEASARMAALRWVLGNGYDAWGWWEDKKS